MVFNKEVVILHPHARSPYLKRKVFYENGLLVPNVHRIRIFIAAHVIYMYEN